MARRSQVQSLSGQLSENCLKINSKKRTGIEFDGEGLPDLQRTQVQSPVLQTNIRRKETEWVWPNISNADGGRD